MSENVKAVLGGQGRQLCTCFTQPCFLCLSCSDTSYKMGGKETYFSSKCLCLVNLSDGALTDGTGFTQTGNVDVDFR